jgi:hypothetical protein
LYWVRRSVCILFVTNYKQQKQQNKQIGLLFLYAVTLGLEKVLQMQQFKSRIEKTFKRRRRRGGGRNTLK